MEHKAWLSPADVDSAGGYVGGSDLVVPGDLQIDDNLGRVVILGDLTVGGELEAEKGTSLVVGGSLHAEGPIWIVAGDLEVGGTITTGDALACDGGQVTAGGGIRTANPRRGRGDS